MENHSHNPAAIKKQVRLYIAVFTALMVLTIVTVAVSRLHLALGIAIGVALIIACCKASLVGGFFMHLLWERRSIRWLLLLVAFFVIALIFLCVLGTLDIPWAAKHL
jgi:caa(3)-type oxidase subunit IV